MSAATRRRNRRRRWNRPRPDRRLRVRDLFLAVLPELPGRGAGAEPDVGVQSRRATHGDRRRAVPARGGAAQNHGGPHHLPQRRTVRPGPDEFRADSGQAGRGRPASAAEKLEPRNPSTCWWSAAARPARPPRSTRRAKALHRRGGRKVRRPGARHHVDREFHFRAAHRRPKARGGAGTARQVL